MEDRAESPRSRYKSCLCCYSLRDPQPATPPVQPQFPPPSSGDEYARLTGRLRRSNEISLSMELGGKDFTPQVFTAHHLCARHLLGLGDVMASRSVTVLALRALMVAGAGERGGHPWQGPGTQLGVEPGWRGGISRSSACGGWRSRDGGGEKLPQAMGEHTGTSDIKFSQAKRKLPLQSGQGNAPATRLWGTTCLCWSCSTPTLSGSPRLRVGTSPAGTSLPKRPGP